MASTAKAAPTLGKSGRSKREESNVVEIDATFGRVLGLTDGQKVGSID